MQKGSFRGRWICHGPAIIYPVQAVPRKARLPHNPEMRDGNNLAPDQPLPSHAGAATMHKADTASHAEWMAQGTQLHSAGQPGQALVAFEKAWALAPLDVNAASACATLLTELDRPRAAYRALQAVEALLMEDADGAANLAIAAEACGDLDKAQAAYARALQLKPDHLRSLNNVGILAASSSQWEIAIGLARKCLDLQPGHAPHHANLCEFLSGARRYPEALLVATQAVAQFPRDQDLKIRHAVLLAFNGELEQSDLALKRMDSETRSLLDDFLHRLESPTGALSRFVSSKASPPTPAPDALRIYVGQACRNLSVCDWRDNGQLTGILRQALSRAAGKQQGRDWHEAPFYGLMLDLREDELLQMRRESVAALDARLKNTLPAFAVRRAPADTGKRIRVGLAVQDLHNAHQVQALQQQLAQHDVSRFAIHVYAFTQQPDPQQSLVLRPCADSVSELAHMTAPEAAARIRLDRLDIYMELGFGSTWCKPEIATMRVAPVQLQQFNPHRLHVPGLWDYSVSDSFVHPDGNGLAQCGAIVRLPQTCWLAAAGNDLPGAMASREEAGLPADALVLCSFLSPATLDSQSFALWLKILRSLPDAVLWLPNCGRAAANLVREAQAAGVGPGRLLFSAPMDRSRALACMQHADLYLDTLRLNSASGLQDALRLGVPAITCAGDNMASRMGGSILHAAGLQECVFENREAYLAGALHLGRKPGALQGLKERLKLANPGAALFDLAARTREWEAAWTVMVERSRTGLPPGAFDVS